MQRSHGSDHDIIRVFLGDNTRIHAQLLTDALARDPRLKVVGFASQSEEIIETAPACKPDVLIISCQLDEEILRGLDVLRKLRLLIPKLRAVVLMDSSRRENVLEAFRAGAQGVLGRHESIESLCKCVQQVYGGQIWANSEQVAYAIAALASAPTLRALDAKGLNLLSKRELDVVRSLAEGLTNREIAEQLGLSQHTIKNYLFRVFDKLGVSNRMELLFLTMNHPVTANSDRPGEPAWKAFSAKMGKASFASCQKAAEQGVAEAQIALAEMYSEAIGVESDSISAYMWYLISEQSALAMKEKISAAKRKLAEGLTTEQILEAQRKAADRTKRNSSVTLERERAQGPAQIAR